MKPLQHHDARMLCQAMLLFLFILSLRSATIDWVQRNGYRDRQVAVPGPESRPGFVLLPMAETGLAFTNQLSDLLALNNQILENGAGLAIGDVDGDGWCDLYLCGAENDNKLFRNLGQWKFEEVTKAAGVACSGQFSTGAVFADTDGDGDLDLLVNGLGVGTRLFLNDGRGQFREDTSSGLKRTGAATSLALADFEGDGDLDLYVTNYRVSSARSDPTPPKLTARIVDGKVMVSPEDRFTGFLRTDGQIEVVEKGEPDVFYLNNGQGKFAPVGWTTGTFLEADGKPVKATPEDWGLSVLFRDLNGDDKPDLYICNDFAHSPDRFWLNTGQGKFRAIDPLAWRNMPLSSMAADVADINRDGHDDLFVVEMLSRNHRTRQHQRANVLKAELNLPFGEPAFRPEVLRNTLQLSRGDGTFAEIAWLAGLAASDWSWSTAFLDVDLDGWEDILVVTGNAHDVLDIDAQNELDRPPPGNTKRGLEFYPRLEQPNLVFRNRGNLTFEDKSDAWRFNATGVSQTLGLGDFDRDGDLDVIAGNLNREVWVYRNDCPAPRIAVRLKGRPPNTAGIGARILVTGGPIMQSQTIQSGGRYLSGDEALRTFAAGSGERFEIEVRWPRGQRSVVKDAPPNHIYEIEEPSPAAGPSESVTSTQPGLNSASRQQPLPRWFEDLSAKLNHAHQDEAFDDFARQPLLPNKVSQLGPGITWFDLNDDGWDDLVVPAGRTGQLAVFQNNGDGHFKRMDWPMFNPPLARDQTTVLGWRKGPGQTLLLAGSSNYEDGAALGPAVRQYDLTAKALDNSFAPAASSTGPMALADIDNDGDLDLFVGGRVIPGRFPEPASSMLARNDHGRFHTDTNNTRRFQGAGLVSGAVFSDLDDDGDPDLALACEWGPVRIFQNDRGQFLEVTEPWGLGSEIGFWSGIAAGDFDGDGAMDLVASNCGRNNHRAASLPWRIYFGDLAGANGVELIECFEDPITRALVPWRARDVIGRSLPGVLEEFPTFRAFAKASVTEMLGDAMTRARHLQVTTLESKIFLNRGQRFASRALPIEAQFSPVFGLAIGDFDGNGSEDLFLAQNFFDGEIESSRADAGRGLLLSGDGRGNFKAIPGQESGILFYGQQRGAAMADYDGDGRIDLAVAQNRSATGLLRNVGAKPGLRVHLRGPDANPQAIGARMRLKTPDRSGPAREIHAGGGYWSQDSATVVLALADGPVQIEVRWPGGKVSTMQVPDSAREIRVSIDGQIERIR